MHTTLSLIDFMASQGMMPLEQLQQLEQRASQQGVLLDELLFEQPGVDQASLSALLAQYYQLPPLQIPEATADPLAEKLLSPEFVLKHKVIPYQLHRDRKLLEVLVMQPVDVGVLDEISITCGFRAAPRYAPPPVFKRFLKPLQAYKVTADDALAKLDATQYDTQVDVDKVQIEKEMATDDAPIVQLVNAILQDAIQKNASDIHMEAHRDSLVVRFRLDGILQDVQTIPKQFTLPVISRMKVVSGMDISERRIPQDGRMEVKYGDKVIDIRVNSMPNNTSESLVCRVLKPHSVVGSFDQLGMEPEQIRQIKRMIQSPNGIFLVTGPTGSGKTSTLYTILKELNQREKKIITLEDPVEYVMKGLNQTPISAKTGLTFATALRAVLRQDPDVIMLGEIRDTETLMAAIHAAMTGHLVLSTLHTNSAVQTLIRLREMGAEPYMIASVLIGVIAQRLVRRICSECKTSYVAGDQELQELGFHGTATEITLYRGTGCEKCQDKGYRGRTGLFEILQMDRELEELIDKDAPSYAVEELAIQKGLITLGMDGERKVAAGMTTVSEVTRVLGVDW